MAAPTITSCSPGSGPKAGGTAVHIVGTGLTAASALTFDGTAATMYSVVNATNILAVAPAGSGTGDVVVTVGGEDGTLTDGFTYTPVYTTATIVKQTLEAIDATLDDDEIDIFIGQAEGIAEAIMGTQDLRTSFDVENHGLVRRFCTNMAAIMCLAYDSTEYTATSQAALTADIMWAQIEFDYLLLKSVDIVKYLKGL